MKKFFAAATLSLLASASAIADGYYQDWYVSDNGVTWTSKGKHDLVYFAEDENKSEYIRIDTKDSSCTTFNQQEQGGFAWMVNGVYVKFRSVCSNKFTGVRLASTVTKAGDRYVIKEILESNVVNINGIEYSAIGFTDARDYISRSNYENAL